MARNHVGIGSKLALAALALFLLPGAKNACGSKEANTTLLSPVQAVTTLLEHEDGFVEAELVLISTAASPHQFVSSAKNASVRVPGGAEVPLKLASDGHYIASSTTDPALVYTGGETYQFSFELDDEAAAKDVAGGNFAAVIDAPDDAVSFEIAEPPEFAGDTARITWTPAARFGIIKIRNQDTGELTYSTFDFDSPQFDGSKWARLQTGGSQELGVDTFPEAGTYIVSFCAVHKISDFDASISAELGALSGFLAGRCAANVEITVAE
jgi:hypothetical protein